MSTTVKNKNYQVSEIESGNPVPEGKEPIGYSKIINFLKRGKVQFVLSVVIISIFFILWLILWNVL